MEPQEHFKYAVARGDIDTREVLAEQVQKGMGLPGVQFVLVLYETIEKLFPSPDPHPTHFNYLPDYAALREWSKARGWMVDYLDAKYIKEEDLRKLRPTVFTRLG